VSRTDGRPASAAQNGIWINERQADLGTIHHIPLEVDLGGGPGSGPGGDLGGDLDVAALRRACAAVLARHPLLGRAVADRGGAPFLVPAVAWPRLLVEPDDPAATRRHTHEPFDLERGPLCRLVLQHRGPGAHRLLVVVHHLVFDGRSVEVFFHDLAAYYRAETGTGPWPAPLPPLTADPVAADERRIADLLPQARRYWAGRPPASDLVVLPGLNRPVHGVHPGEPLELWPSERVRARFGPAAERMGVSRFELALAAVHALLFRYGNDTPATALDLGTRTPDLQDRVGVYVNELPFTSAPRGGVRFADFARDLRARLRELYRVRAVPLGRVGVPLTPGVALAPVSLTYVRHGPAPDFGAVRATRPRVVFNDAARNALRVQVFDGDGGLRVVLQYPPAFVAPEDAAAVGRHLLTVLDHVVTAPDTTLAALPVPDPDERHRVLTAWNDTAVTYPRRTVPSLVADRAGRTPDAVAVVHGERRLTYTELGAAAGQVATGLRRAGIGPGSLVAVHAERTEWLVPTLLGVLATGAAYLPLDHALPARRREFMVTDSGAAAELRCTDPHLDRHTAPGTTAADRSGRGPAPESATVLGAGPRDLAYVIYTSGSTGRPKGVRIEHRSLTNLLLAMRDLMGAGPGDRWLALTSASFDISALEFFLPLVTGGTLVVAGDRDVGDGAALRELISRHGVTHVQATPTTWAMLLDAGFGTEPGTDHGAGGGPGLGVPTVTALVGGEALPEELARRLRPRVRRLVNVYGPTETTIWSTADEVDPAAGPVTIGRPLANTRALVLDARLQPVPVGIPGDLYLAGTGLARGYHGRPRLDATRFVADPFGRPGGRMYRTGDRVRHRRDGRLEFLGRLDDQVKLRGHRIELGEVEACLLAQPGVRRAAAAVRDDRLVGYHVGGEAATLRRTLAATLPAYLVPDSFVRLDALPTTPNGKLDRAALPHPAPTTGGGTDARAGAALDTVRAIWREVLALPQLDDSENLFDLGGHSVTMNQISVRIRDRLGVDVPLAAYFDSPTVAGIAAVVAELRASGSRC
jgi:amino acid adenylation domain-containing protein